MKINGGLTVIIVVIGIALGFFLGRSSGPKAESSESAGPDGPPPLIVSPQSDGSRGLGSGRAGERPSGKGRSPEAAIRRVARTLELSPMAQMDFDGMFETYEAIRWMNPDEIQVALEELDAMGAGNQAKQVLNMMLLNLWAKQDGRGAVEYSLNSDNQMMKAMGVMSGIMGWMKNDPEGAYAWYDENKDEVRKSGGMMGGQVGAMMFAALAQNDMDGAFERLDDLSTQEQRSALSMMGAQTVMDPDRRERFIAQLDKLGDDELAQTSLQSMVTMWAFQDPKGAVEFVDSREWDEGSREQILSQVAQSWANIDPKAALDWRLENLGESEDRGQAISSSFANWMVQDSESARQWLKEQPPELRTDSLYQQTANSLQYRDNYEEAVQWAEQIQEPEARKSTYREIYGRWQTSDEAKAQEWLQRLDPEIRDAIVPLATPAVEEVSPVLDEGPP